MGAPDQQKKEFEQPGPFPEKLQNKKSSGKVHEAGRNNIKIKTESWKKPAALLNPLSRKPDPFLNSINTESGVLNGRRPGFS